jgi:integrase
VVRVAASGAVTFRYRFKRLGKTRHMVLGRYPALTLEAARDAHDAASKLLREGKDPIAAQAVQEAANTVEQQAASITVADMVDQFVHRKLRGERWDSRQETWVRDPNAKTKARKRPDDAARLLDKDIVKKLGKLPARELTKRDIIGRLDAIVDRGAPIVANRVYALFKQCLDFAVAKDLVPASPMAGMEAPGGEEVPRERTLSDAEVKTFWKKVDEAEMSPRVALALRLAVVTAQRRIEVATMKWTDINETERLWTIPGEYTKNGVVHVVPLSDLAKRLLADIKALGVKNEYVLHSAHTKQRQDGHLTERALTRAIAENEDVFGLDHFRPHDFRRTFRTFASKEKIAPHVAERVINHTPEKLARTYDRYDYVDEKRDALDKWGAHIEKVTTGPSPASTSTPLAPN